MPEWVMLIFYLSLVIGIPYGLVILILIRWNKEEPNNNGN
tara:strand:+ start:489 stop:608 length:120 start_codon:yes stop_codon:yes gene_type:complete